jgi:hypothetical protein
MAIDLKWKTVWSQVHDCNGKVASICFQEAHEDLANLRTPLATRCFGPNGVQTETYQQMLDLLATPAPADGDAMAPEERAAGPRAGEPGAQSPPITAESAIAGPANPTTQAAVAEYSKQEFKGEVNVPSEPDYDDYEQEEEGDIRPHPITTEDIARIDEMSPDELNAFIEDVDAHEEWEELRREAKERIEAWRGGLKKAHESPRCAHVRTNGSSCGSPALKDDAFCFFHSQTRAAREPAPAGNGLQLPSLEDSLGVQLAIMRVCGMIMDKTLDEKTGRAVLAGLRLAQRNLGHANTLYGGLNDLT